MAASPQWKVYSPAGEYVASCKHGEDAGAIVGMYGENASIRLGHRQIVWLEGHEMQEAAESYDYVASLIKLRAKDSQRAWVHPENA